MKKNILSLAALAACLVVGGAPVWAMETDDCLGCHGSADDVGEANVINAQLFAQTAHASEGCSACHDVADGHPDDGQSTALSANCADCHDTIAAQYTASEHGANATCTDCHDAHQALPPVSLSGTQMNVTCQGCHEPVDVENSHARWLPQADVHIRSVPCVTCHSSSQQFAITLYVSQRQGNRAYADYELVDHAQLQKIAGAQAVSSVVDTDLDGQVSLAELGQFYKGSEKSGLRLWAMMTPETVDHDFRTMDNRWDCTYCHAAGPDAMKNSYVAFPRADGSYERIPMEQGATLDALFGTPDFYMVGSTRSNTLNIIGLLILLGGLAMPIGHGTLRFLTRKNRRKDH